MIRGTNNSKSKRIKEITDRSEWDDLFKGGILITKKTSTDCEFDGYRVLCDLSFSDINVQPTRKVDVRINDCDFLGKVRILKRKMNLTFEDCEFHSEIDASNSDLGGKIRFRSCTFFGLTNFRNTKFRDLADFWKSSFTKETIFYKTDFFGTAVFSAATFEKNVLFTYTLIEKLILFRGTKIYEGIDLSTAIIAGSVGTFGLSVPNFEAKKGKLSDEEFETSVSKTGEIPIKNKRETFRILKQANIQQNNVIESIPYQVLEKLTLYEELKTKIREKKADDVGWRRNFKNKLSPRLDLFVLWLNKKSNYFGKAPFQGVLFTLIVGLIFFIPSIYQTDKYELAFAFDLEIFKTEATNYFKFLLPTHGIDYLGKGYFEGGNINVGFLIFDILGRIFVGFGIYQTIQAFRKFR